jgi:hypothetical protein
VSSGQLCTQHPQVLTMLAVPHTHNCGDKAAVVPGVSLMPVATATPALVQATTYITATSARTVAATMIGSAATQPSWHKNDRNNKRRNKRNRTRTDSRRRNRAGSKKWVVELSDNLVQWVKCTTYYYIASVFLPLHLLYLAGVVFSSLVILLGWEDSMNFMSFFWGSFIFPSSQAPLGQPFTIMAGNHNYWRLFFLPCFFEFFSHLGWHSHKNVSQVLISSLTAVKFNASWKYYQSQMAKVHSHSLEVAPTD